jgi:RNA polymerase sigma factor (sigma-70 family)
MSQGAESSAEQSLVQQCLAGENEALSKLYADFLSPVLNLLVSRGVEATLAKEVIGALWADCVVRRDGQPALLEKFNSKSSLCTWLFRVALNRVFDRNRADQRVNYLTIPSRSAELEGEDLLLAEMPAAERVAEPDLAALLRECLQAGFEACPAEDLLKLRLNFLHGLTQRELARLWDCHEVTIARDTQRALQLIADQTLRAIKRRDPRLRLTWDDFLELCDADPMDFL